jgi:hypothetical protein
MLGPWRSKRPERGKGKKSSKEEGAVMSSVGPTWAHKPSFPSPTRDGKESDPGPSLFILATFSPSFLLHSLLQFYSTKLLILKLFVLPS